MAGRLSRYDFEVLETLAEDGGFCVLDISARLKNGFLSDNKRKRSAMLADQLSRLEKDGWVKRLDGKKPIAWLRTAAGTAALAGGR